MKNNKNYGIYDFSDYADEITGTELFLINGGGPSCSGGAQVTGGCGGGSSSAGNTGNGTSTVTTTAPASCSGGAPATGTPANPTTEQVAKGNVPAQPENPINTSVPSGVITCGGSTQKSQEVPSTNRESFDENKREYAGKQEDFFYEEYFYSSPEDGYVIDNEKKLIIVNIQKAQFVRNACSSFYVLSDRGYKIQFVENSKVIKTCSNSDDAQKYLYKRYTSFFKTKNDVPGVYTIDSDRMVVRADIKNLSNVEEAYCAYYILGDRGYSFELCDNDHVIHVFKDTETVNYYIKRTRNWERNKYLDNKVANLKEAEVLCEEGYLEELPYGKSVCHKQGVSTLYDTSKNRKFVSIDGKHEFVFNEHGNLVTDPVNLGTYNYSSPSNWIGHVIDDLKPWIQWGTGPDDPTTMWERALATFSFGTIKYNGRL